MRLSGAALFSGALAAAGAYAVLTALKWPPKAALFPLTMGIPLLVLCAAQTVVELRDPSVAEALGRRGFAVFAWMAVFIVLVLIAGFPVAVPIFIFSYLMMESRERWWLAIALAVAGWGFFHLLFERLLHFPFEAGLIQEWFQ
jgi:heme A synthase